MEPATAAPTIAPPAATSAPTLIAMDDPPADGMVPEGNLPPLGPRRLTRGLQIPSRASRIRFGFRYPEILAQQGIAKWQWKLFKRELKRFARLTFSQQLTALVVVCIVEGLASLPVGQFAG